MPDNRERALELAREVEEQQAKHIWSALEDALNEAEARVLERAAEIASAVAGMQHVDGDRLYRNGWRAGGEAIERALRAEAERARKGDA